MSFLDEIKKKKKKLVNVETVITGVDGRTYTENAQMRDSGTCPKICESVPKKYGFVVDSKPDNVPIEVIPGLFIGSQDCLEDSVVNSSKFTNILSIGIDSFTSLPKLFINCLDLPETDIGPVLKQSNVYIDKVLQNSGTILVHCNAGVSRSSMVVIGYLILEKKYSFSDAYNLLKRKRPCIQPNPGFIKQLKNL